jgi:hypothetical protein
MCEVCHGESGGEEVGVACIPGVPMSISWCSECLKHEAFPSFVFDYDFIFVGEGDLNHLNDYAKNRVTWFDGKYVGFLDYVKRITPEQVKQELDEMNSRMSNYEEGEDGNS